MTIKSREDLTGEHHFGDAGQALCFIVFIAVWITDAFFFNYSTLLNDYVPFAVRLTLGIIVLLIAGYLAATSIYIVFIQVREKPHVIRKNVFRFLRHPMYFSEMLLYLGLLLFSISLAGAAVWIMSIFFLHYLCRHEERLLLARFGEDYRRYMEEVPMYFLRFRRKK